MSASLKCFDKCNAEFADSPSILMEARSFPSLLVCPKRKEEAIPFLLLEWGIRGVFALSISPRFS